MESLTQELITPEQTDETKLIREYQVSSLLQESKSDATDSESNISDSNDSGSMNEQTIERLYQSVARTIVTDFPLPNDQMEQLKQIGFEFTGKLGNGIFGIVYKCKLTQNKGGIMEVTELACKKVTLSNDSKFEQQLKKNQLPLVTKCEHPNLTDMFEIYIHYNINNLHQTTALVFTELCTGNLMEFKLSHLKGYMTEEQAGRWFIQIAYGLQYLHFSVKDHYPSDGPMIKKMIPIAHGLISERNILYKGTNPYLFKLADFSLGELLKSEDENVSDIIREDIYKLSKVLSNSVLLRSRAETIINDIHYSMKDTSQLMHEYKLSSELIELIRKMSQPDQSNRPDINEVIDNPWVEPFNKLYRPTGIQFN